MRGERKWREREIKTFRFKCVLLCFCRHIPKSPCGSPRSKPHREVVPLWQEQQEVLRDAWIFHGAAENSWKRMTGQKRVLWKAHSWNHGMVRVGRDLKNSLIAWTPFPHSWHCFPIPFPTPCSHSGITTGTALCFGLLTPVPKPAERFRGSALCINIPPSLCGCSGGLCPVPPGTAAGNSPELSEG